MSMNADAMTTEVVAAINALSPTDKVDATKCWRAALGAIISHIQANAQVTVGTGDAGLQLDNTGHATMAPSVSATLHAGCIS